MAATACHSAANRETATSPSPPARRGNGDKRTLLCLARLAATACRSTAIRSARSSCSRSPEARRHPPECMHPTEGSRPFRSPFLRLLLAYTIGVNVFGLALALSYVVASLVHLDMSSVAGLIGGLAGIALGIIAGWRTNIALKRISQG